MDDPHRDLRAGVEVCQALFSACAWAGIKQVRAWEYWIAGSGKKPRKDAADTGVALPSRFCLLS